MLPISFVWLEYLIFVAVLIGFPQAAQAESQWVQIPLLSKMQKTMGLKGGEGLQMTMSISYSSSNPEVVYFSSDTAQVWKSIDEGKSWVSMHSGFDAHGARSIFVDPFAPNVVFAAAFLGKSYEYANTKKSMAKGIYMSTDGGATWEKVFDAGFYRQEQTRGNIFACDSRSQENGRARVLYAGSYTDGLLRSEDFGRTWQSVGLAGSPINEIVEDPDASGTIYVATEKGLFAWRGGNVISLGSGLPDWPRSISAAKGGILYAAVGKSGVYKSTDKGKSFVSQQRGLPFGQTFTDVAASPVDGNIVYVKATQGLFRGPYFSHDGGEHWQAAEDWDKGDIIPHDNLFWFSSPIAVHPRDPLKAIIASNGKGMILRTEDGGKNWEYSSTGFTGGRMTDIAFIDEQTMLFGLFDHGFFFTEDKGETFEGLSETFPTASKTIMACTGNAGTLVGIVQPTSQTTYICVSVDKGLHWKYFEQLNKLPQAAYAAFHPDGKTVYAGYYRSDDRGNSWKELKYAVMSMFAGNGDYVYTVDALDDTRCRIIRSNDKGEKWETVYPILPFSYRLIQKIAVSPDNPDHLYVAANWNGLWILESGQWRQVGPEQGIVKDSFGTNFVKLVEVDPSVPGRVLVGKWAPGMGQGNGVFESNDGGRSFTNITGNIGPELSVWGLKVSPYDGSVFVGTSRGTYKMVSGQPTNQVNPPLEFNRLIGY
ncbi:MAG: hypothetical protein AB1461_03990 [Thermodesulfobacteriota bacterium]